MAPTEREAGRLEILGEAHETSRDAVYREMRGHIQARMQRLAEENARLKERITALDAERTSLALTSQQQQGAFEALRDLLTQLPED
jgi:chromosome segregation ATPase